MSLGSIIVRLTMNTADFETDAGRAAKVAQKRAAEIDKAFKKAGAAIGVALGAAVAGTAVAIKSTIDRMDDMSKSAQKVGMSTEEFSKLAYAGELADVAMETLQGALGKLTKSQAAALKETSEQARVFDALGISAKNADGSLRSSADVLADFADVFRDMQGSPEAMAAGFALFGRSFQELIPLIKDGGEGIRAAGDELERMGGVLSTDAGLAAEEFNDNLSRMKTAIGTLSQGISTELLPALVNASGRMVDLARDGELASNMASVFSGIIGAGVSIVEEYNNAVSRTSIAFDVLAGAAAGAKEVMNNIGLNGLVDDGSIAGGYAKVKGAIERGQADLDALGDRQERNKLFQNVTGGTSAYVSEADQFAAEVERRKKAMAAEERLRAALGGGSKSTRKSGGGGKTDEQKASDELAAAYDREVESLHQKLYMLENVGEAARLNYELESGSLKALDEPRAQVLRNLQAQAEAAQKLADGKRLTDQYKTAEEDAAEAIAEATKLLSVKAITQETLNRVIAANQTPAQQMLADMQFEIELLGKTREQIELLTAARFLGAEAATAQGQAALEAMRAQQEASREMDRQISLMDDFRDGMTNAITDFVTGAKSMKDAFKDFADDFAARITQMIAEKWIEQLFGAQGSSGAGTTGGDWLGGILGALFGGGKGYSTGGYTGSGGVMQPAGIVHRGEVVWSQTDVARAGGVGKVEAMRIGGGGGATLNQTFVVQGTPDRRTREQMSRESGRQAARAMARTGR